MVVGGERGRQTLNVIQEDLFVLFLFIIVTETSRRIVIEYYCFCVRPPNYVYDCGD